MRIEAAKERVEQLPLRASVLKSLRETARIASTHYSTKIEGNRLSLAEVAEVVLEEKRLPGRVRDGDEVSGYYRALTYLEEHVVSARAITENFLRRLHGLVMSGVCKKGAALTPYRDGQNVIYEGASRRIVYMPPEAKDVPVLMRGLLGWLREQGDLFARRVLCAESRGLLCGARYWTFAQLLPWPCRGRHNSLGRILC